MMKQSSIKPQTAKGLRMREPAPFWHCRENRTCILTFRTQLESDEHFYSVHDTDSVKVFINGQKLTIPKVKTRQGHVFLCPVNACPFYNRDAAQMRLHSTREHSNGEVWVSESTNPAPTPGVIGSVLKRFSMFLEKTKSKLPNDFAAPQPAPRPQALPSRFAASENHSLNQVLTNPFSQPPAVQQAQGSHSSTAPNRSSFAPRTLVFQAPRSAKEMEETEPKFLVDTAQLYIPTSPTTSAEPRPSPLYTHQNNTSATVVYQAYKPDFIRPAHRGYPRPTHLTAEISTMHTAPAPINTILLTRQPAFAPLENPEAVSLAPTLNPILPSAGSNAPQLFSKPTSSPANNLNSAEFSTPHESAAAATEPPTPTGRIANTVTNKRVRVSNPSEDTIEEARREARRKINEIGERMLKGSLSPEEMLKAQQDLDMVVTAQTYYLRALRFIEEA